MGTKFCHAKIVVIKCVSNNCHGMSRATSHEHLYNRDTWCRTGRYCLWQLFPSKIDPWKMAIMD